MAPEVVTFEMAGRRHQGLVDDFSLLRREILRARWAQEQYERFGLWQPHPPSFLATAEQE